MFPQQEMLLVSVFSIVIFLLQFFNSVFFADKVIFLQVPGKYCCGQHSKKKRKADEGRGEPLGILCPDKA